MGLSPPRLELLAALQGQRLHLPDLRLLFKHWPHAVNPHLAELRRRCPEVLAGITSNSRYLEKLNKADFALFACLWWPTADLEAAHVVMCVAIWLFLWDDEIDHEVGRLSADFDAAQQYRQETIQYIRYCLGFSAEAVPVPSNKIIALFKVLGDAASKSYDVEHREILLTELEFFMGMSELEQKRRLSPALPTVQEYYTCRMGTSATNVTTFFNELAQRIHVPAYVLADPYMKTLWDETNMIVWRVNDLLSIKKEIQQQTVDSLVPLLYRKFGNLQKTTQLIIQDIEKAVGNFDLVARLILSKYSHDEKLASSIALYIDGCRQNCTGNLYWSLQTVRYGVGPQSIGGGVTIDLE